MSKYSDIYGGWERGFKGIKNGLYAEAVKEKTAYKIIFGISAY